LTYNRYKVRGVCVCVCVCARARACACVSYMCNGALRGNAVQSFATIKQLSQDDNNIDNNNNIFMDTFVSGAGITECQ